MSTSSTPARTLRIASVPAGHVYVRHLAAPAAAADQRVVRLLDPPVEDATVEGQWWPPPMLEPEWVRAHAAEFDVFHVHFGFDAVTPARLTELVDTLDELGKPLVQTVHDLRNPHHASSDLHDAQMDVLVRRAAALITLTPGAAEEIRRRWGREAMVLPHPHVVDVPTLQTLSRSTGGGEVRVGLHVKSLRASMDPVAVLPVLGRAVEQIPGGILQINGHRDVMLPDGERWSAALADAIAALTVPADVRVHDYMSDAELWQHLGSLDVSVLPYRFGTHSGWLEACRDLGTAVVAPSCGYYADQGPVHTFTLDEHRFDERSLVRAVVSAASARPDPADVRERLAERSRTADAHADLYARLVA